MAWTTGPRTAEPGAVLVPLPTAPPPPRTPSRRATRLVLNTAVHMIPGIAVLVLGSLFAGVFCWGIPFELALDLHGSRAAAIVTKTELRTWESRNKKTPTVITFRYRVDGATYESSYASIDAALIARAPTGSSLEIEYVPWLPDVARPRGQSYSFFGYAVFPVLIIPPIGLALFIGGIASLRRKRALYRDGHPVVATQETHRWTYKGHPKVKISWTYTHAGAQYRGETGDLPPDARDLLDKPALVVLVDPRDPKESLPFIV